MQFRRPTLLAIAALCVISPTQAQDNATMSKIVDAANRFLNKLDTKQRKSVMYSFNDDEQRRRWSNFPTGFVPRGGISLKQMTPEQQGAAMDLLKVVLSPAGYQKVNEIRLADDDFKANGSRRPRQFNGPPPGSGGPPPGAPPGPPPGNGRPPQLSGDMFGSDLYYISFLGEPSLTNPWMLQFGGHHLALNITAVGKRGILTPSLTGAQPATFQYKGKTVRPIGNESDKALALLQSLNPGQRQKAILPYQVPDLVLGPGQDGKTIAPEGLKASELNGTQRGMLLDLIHEWAGIVNDDSAFARMVQLHADLDQTYFAWSGPTTFPQNTNVTAYYRIQGPHLVIEYAPQHDEPANHIHTIYRDPTNDYGKQLTNQ